MGESFPPHPQAIALLPPAPVLSRNSAENFCLRGYYTPTPPLRGCYTLALPHLFVCSSFEHMFCQGIAPKNFYLQRRQKFFAPLTTTKTTIINTRAERSPAPRLNYFITRRTLGGLFSRQTLGRTPLFNNWGRGKNVKSLNNFAPSPIVKFGFDKAGRQSTPTRKIKDFSRGDPERAQS